MKVTPVEKKPSPQYLEIKMDDMSVMIRRSDNRINGTHILKIAGLEGYEMAGISKELNPNSFDTVKGTTNCQGTYVDFAVGVGLCRKYGLRDLEKRPGSIQSVPEESVVEFKPSVFIQVQAFPSIMVRRSDLRINSSQILSLVNKRGYEAAKIQKAFGTGTCDGVRGNPKYSGTYVDFFIGIELCRKFELAELAERLLQLRSGSNSSTSKPTVVSPGNLNKVLGSTGKSPLPEPVFSNPACSRNRASIPRELAEEQVTAENANCMDSASDTEGSESSTNSHGSASIQGGVRPPNQLSSVDSPAGPRLQDDAQYSLFDVADCRDRSFPSPYEFWDEQSERSHPTDLKSAE